MWDLIFIIDGAVVSLYPVLCLIIIAPVPECNTVVRLLFCCDDLFGRMNIP